MPLVVTVAEQFPLSLLPGQLQAADFVSLEESFCAALRRHLPTAREISFIEGATLGTGRQPFSQPFSRSFARSFPGPLADLPDRVREMLAGEKMVLVSDPLLLLAFPLLREESGEESGEYVLAVLTDTDPLFRDKVDGAWLEECRQLVAAEFILLKEARRDRHTGFLNLANLEFLLSRPAAADCYRQLLLVELPPRRAAFSHCLRHIRRGGSLLQDIFPADEVRLHWLGHGLFALLRNCREGEGQGEIEQRLVALLQREGFHRVHIGSSHTAEAGAAGGRELLDQAWQALRQAGGRGPFSFASHPLHTQPEKHPLARPAAGISRRVNRLCRTAERFALVRFASDTPGKGAVELVLPAVERRKAERVADDLVVFLAGEDGPGALAWAREVVATLAADEPARLVSAGVAAFPHADFSRSEILQNCRRALLHAAFFGAGSAVLCDAVSMNISGDIFFAEGNLAAAVREYRRGLKCDPNDVNLHNSLGVALAMMNRLALARLSFEQALALAPTNFMALYNLGLAEQAGRRREQAYAYLEQALHHFDRQEGGDEVYRDLQLQLGMLAAETGRHRTAIEYLQAWRGGGPARQADRACYHLGQAHFALGELRQAMVELQRALRFNETDDRAMHLLARAYCRAGEGDDIALALCRKSVELEPREVAYRLLLAEVLARCGLWQEAKENARRCRRSRHHRDQALALLAPRNNNAGA